MSDAKLDMRPGETQVLRAAREVLRRGRIEAVDPGQKGVKGFRVIEKGSQAVETVRADPLWVKRPTCSCMAQFMNDQYRGHELCRHIVAVLVKEEDLRCQLLDLLL